MKKERRYFTMTTEHESAIRQLSEEEAGTLLMMIFAFVNGRDPFTGFTEEQKKYMTHDVVVLYNVISEQIEKELRERYN